MSEKCPHCGQQYEPKPYVPPFAVGDRVLWSHVVSPPLGRGAVIRLSAALSQDQTAEVGTVVEAVGRNTFRVQLDDIAQDVQKALTAQRQATVDAHKELIAAGEADPDTQPVIIYLLREQVLGSKTLAAAGTTIELTADELVQFVED